MKSMSRQFYATRQDLLPGLRALESERRLQYVLEEMAPEPTPVIFRSAFEIPGLGVAEYGDYSGEHTFLVDEWGTRITMGETPQTKGGVLYEVSLATNPTAFAFQPAGRFGDRTLILGSVGTATGDPKSLALCKWFWRGLRKGFTKVQWYFVGPEAYRLLQQGWRLTTATQCPPEFDLRI